MALKDEWKDTEKNLGDAISGLGKNLVRTAKVGAEKISDWADGGEHKDDVHGKNVTNDGSWKQTEKELGDAMSGLGKAILSTAKAGVDKVSEKLDPK